jgi:hypothetical protein
MPPRDDWPPRLLRRAIPEREALNP